MKTTLDLPDDLLIEAKAVAARRRTTLKQMIEHALRREIFHPETPFKETSLLEKNALGFPIIKRRGKGKVTSEMVYRMMEEEGI